MRFPLNLTFKILALAPQVFVRDADGALQLYVRQKALKLKEAVTVFADEAQTQVLYTINADRIIDIRARYTIRDASGAELGHLQGKGMRSLWKLHYEVSQNGETLFDIREANPWVKIVDGLFGEIPVLGLFSGYFFHPRFNVTRPDGSVVFQLEKQPAFLEGKYTIQREGQPTPNEEGIAILSLLMMLLLERRRG